MADTDFDVREFAYVLSSLPDYTPICDEFGGTDADTDERELGVWYTSQRIHMVGWFSAQLTEGQGAYSRLTGNFSAKTAYNRLQNPTALLWIGEALGAEKSVVRAAADEASAQKDHRRRCGIIRKHIPWKMISDLALQ